MLVLAMYFACVGSVGRMMQESVHICSRIGACDSRMHLINDHKHTHLFGHPANLVCEEACDMMIASSRLNWLQNNCSDFDSLNVFPVLNFLFHVCQRVKVLLAIIGLVGWVLDWVSIDWWVSHGPVESWNIDLSERTNSVCVSCGGQTSQHCSVEAVFEGKNSVRRGAWLLIFDS